MSSKSRADWYVKKAKSAGPPSITTSSDVICVYREGPDRLIAEGPHLPNQRIENFQLQYLVDNDYEHLNHPSHYAHELQERLTRADPQRTVAFILSKLEELGSSTPAESLERCKGTRPDPTPVARGIRPDRPPISKGIRPDIPKDSKSNSLKDEQK